MLLPVVYYDRILVMDGGRVAEFDTPLELFDREGSIFRSLCDEAHLSRQDILRIRASVRAGSGPGMGQGTESSVPASSSASVA